MSEFIDVSIEKPPLGLPVIGIIDYTEFGFGRIIGRITRRNSLEPVVYGKKGQFHGTGEIIGEYYTIHDKVLPPDSVTHWFRIPNMPIPRNRACEKVIWNV